MDPQSRLERVADLQGGVVATAIAFMSGLAGWTAAVLLAGRIHAGLPFAALAALAATLIIVLAVRWAATRLTETIGRIS